MDFFIVFLKYKERKGKFLKYGKRRASYILSILEFSKY